MVIMHSDLIISHFQVLREASDHQHVQSALGEYLTQRGYAELMITMYKSLKQASDNSMSDIESKQQAGSNLISMMSAYAQFTAASKHMCAQLGMDDTLPYLTAELQTTVFPVEELPKSCQREIMLKLEILYHCIRQCSDLRALYRKHNAIECLTKFLSSPEVNISILF